MNARKFQVNPAKLLGVSLVLLLGLSVASLTLDDYPIDLGMSIPYYVVPLIFLSFYIFYCRDCKVAALESCVLGGMIISAYSCVFLVSCLSEFAEFKRDKTVGRLFLFAFLEEVIKFVALLFFVRYRPSPPLDKQESLKSFVLSAMSVGFGFTMTENYFSYFSRGLHVVHMRNVGSCAHSIYSALAALVYTAIPNKFLRFLVAVLCGTAAHFLSNYVVLYHGLDYRVRSLVCWMAFFSILVKVNKL